MFKPKYKVINSDKYNDCWTIFERKWYSLFWKPTNIYCTDFEGARDIMHLLKAELA